MTDLGPALTLGQTLDRAAERFPDRTAVVFKGERITYADLRCRADAFARGLLALGLGPGDTGSGKVQKFKQRAYAVEKYALKAPV